MSEVTPAAPAPGAAPNAATNAAPLVVNVQYVKDLSFEVPGAPQVYAALRTPPHVNINLDVQVRRQTENASMYEVTLAVRAEASERPGPAGGEAKPVFIAELSYAGLFTLTGLPENAIEPVLLVECPRLLFPYARNILAEITRDGGFPPVLLQPIDFVALWQSRRGQTGTA